MLASLAGNRIIRNQWIRQWAIEQILENQAAADKRLAEEKLREVRAQLRSPSPEVPRVVERQPVKAKTQRRRKTSSPGPKVSRADAPRPDLVAASREVRAGLFAQQSALKARIAELERQVAAAQREALSILDYRPVRPQKEPHLVQSFKRMMGENASSIYDEFLARAAARMRQRKIREQALALLTLLAA